jgi:SAM-dependent MidA family methyltransferase
VTPDERIEVGVRPGWLPPADPGSDPELVDRIRAEIADRGPITFARFMERALYEPGLGYYRRPRPGPGRRGDFLTAPETHPIFGRTVGRQLDEVWQRLDRPDPFVVREHGAGEGALAVAILDGLRADRSGLADAVRYEAVEVEPARLDAFATRLADAGHARRRADQRRGADSPAIVGAVLANEVLDALPVHRVEQRSSEMVELLVGWQDDRFVEVVAPPTTPLLVARLRSEGVRLVEGQRAEICLALDPWIGAAAAGLERGVMVLIDYGHRAADLYGARRRAGTLAAYVNHRVHDDPFPNVGRQDLTAHVDVTAVERAAVDAGLVQLGMTTQAEFLAGLGIDEILREVQADPATTLESYLALRSGLLRLLDPAATGGFRVMAFGRRLPADPRPLRGFSFRRPAREKPDTTTPQ